MELINNVFSWIIKKRIHQMEFFMKYPHDVQQRILFRLIRSAKRTVWGEAHGYGSITSYDAYINRVPLQSYASLKPYIDRIKEGEKQVLWPSNVPWMAQSSGTETGKSKSIPVTKESLYGCHYKGGKDLLAIYHHNHPQSKLILGKVLVVGGAGVLNQRKGIYAGDLSAILMNNFPVWVEKRRVPELSIALMQNWEAKIEKMACSVAKENVSNISGVPSWTLLLLKRILEIEQKDNLLEVWPNLELFMHGGVSFTPYKAQFKALIHGNMNYYENYNASEGFFGIQDQSGEEGMLLMLDYGIFYEFIESSEIQHDHPKTILLDQVQLNTVYAVVISTNSGLWRYVIGDTIQFVTLNPFRIKVVGRIKHFINAFGEEIIVDNAEKAMEIACREANAVVGEYTAAPVFMSTKTSGRHQWLIEFEKSPDSVERFAIALDTALKALNADYEAKRSYNMVLTEPEITPVPKGTFYKWLKMNNKLGGQHKVPRLFNDRLYVDQLLELIR